MTDTLTLGGITFTADQIKSVTVVIDGREITVGEKKKEDEEMGFK